MKNQSLKNKFQKEWTCEYCWNEFRIYEGILVSNVPKQEMFLCHNCFKNGESWSIIN